MCGDPVRARRSAEKLASRKKPKETALSHCADRTLGFCSEQARARYSAVPCTGRTTRVGLTVDCLRVSR
eukprot:3869888-Rhodomonas_salina.3